MVIRFFIIYVLPIMFVNKVEYNILLTFSGNFVKIRSELFDLCWTQTDRQTIDKRDATKSTQAETFNNPLSTEAVYISVVSVIFLLASRSRSLVSHLASNSFTVSICNDTF